jgi:hypothetical protein
MGQHADDCLIMCEEYAQQVSDFHMGGLSITQAYDLGIVDEQGYEPNEQLEGEQ